MTVPPVAHTRRAWPQGLVTSGPTHLEALIDTGINTDASTATHTTEPPSRTPTGDLTGVQLEQIKDRLVSRYTGRPDLSGSTIRAVVDEVLAGFADAPVRAYISILVERGASRRLAPAHSGR